MLTFVYNCGFQHLPLAIASLSVAVSRRALIPCLANDIVTLGAIVHALVALGVTPARRRPSPSLRQNLLGFIAGVSAVGSSGVGIAGWAFVARFWDVGVGDC